MTRRWLILIPGVVLAAAACGGGAASTGIASLQGDEVGTDSSTTTTTVDTEQAMLDFAQCMRDHGIDMPDPEINSAGGGVGFTFSVQGDSGEGPDSAEMQKMQAANEACQHFLQGVVQQFEQPDMSQMQDQLLAFAQCMRDHGIDYPDPVFSDDGGVTLSAPGPDQGGFDPSDPDFQAAQEACNSVFGGQGPMTIVGGGPGGAGGGAGVIIGGGPGAPGGGDDSSSGG
jgi:hypothetical protein